jgi:Asp/Glu/hydantoin racemase
MARVALIHTVLSVVEPFNRLLKERVKEIDTVNILDEYIIKDLSQRGEFTHENMCRLYLLFQLAVQSGPDVIMTTCSSLSVAVDQIKPFIGIPVLKIDEGMIREAVKTGKKITVMATVGITLKPTVKQLKDAAFRDGKTITIREILCSEAMDALKKGDVELHDQLLLQKAEELKGQDAVILAQASMAGVKERLQDIIPGCPVLSSPGYAVESIAAALGL